MSKLLHMVFAACGAWSLPCTVLLRLQLHNLLLTSLPRRWFHDHDTLRGAPGSGILTLINLPRPWPIALAMETLIVNQLIVQLVSGALA